MAERFSFKQTQLAFVLVIFILLFLGLQSAFACLRQNDQAYKPAVRVDNCHLVISQTPVPSCCQSEACHQTTPLQRDLGSPEYHNQQKNSHPLAQESRSLTPQLKVGQPFRINHIDPPQFTSIAGVSQIPLQSLDSLRTIVLLN